MTRLLLAALAGLAGPAAAQPPPSVPVLDTMEQRMQACVVCHGREGRATREGYFPRIAGKPAGYLNNQLVNFRAGRRSNATMTYLVEHMSDEYLREIAAYFSTLDLPYAPPQPAPASAQALERGRQLVTQGDAQRGVPACARCHGERMTGAEPAMPGLLGLPHYYVAGQLGAWRTGLRRAAAPDCMADIAKALTEDDVAAVAAWLSAQPMPSDPKPAASVPTPLPKDCGSGLR